MATCSWAIDSSPVAHIWPTRYIAGAITSSSIVPWARRPAIASRITISATGASPATIASV